MTYPKKQNKWTETVPGECQISDFLGKDFKITVLNMLNELKEKWKELKESGKWCMNKMRISLEREIIKKNQT